MMMMHEINLTSSKGRRPPFFEAKTGHKKDKEANSGHRREANELRSPPSEYKGGLNNLLRRTRQVKKGARILEAISRGGRLPRKVDMDF